MKKQKFLMCPPTYFNIQYSINPWMNKRNKANKTKTKQWESFKNKFISLNAEVEILPPQRELPDMVYVDAGIVYKNFFIPSNFYHKERQGEKKHIINWFKANNFHVTEIPQIFYFEGHGDTLWSGNKIFFGYGFRSSVEAHYEAANIFENINKKIKIIPVELIDPRFYHLDTCFCPLDEKKALFFPKAFSKKAQAMLGKNIDLIPVSEKEAVKFACNSVILNSGDVIIPKGSPLTCQKLKRLGYKTHEMEMSEFIKGGGACKCLSLLIN